MKTIEGRVETAMRVFAISDVHADYPQNMALIQGLSGQEYRCDTLLRRGT